MLRDMWIKRRANDNKWFIINLVTLVYIFLAHPVVYINRSHKDDLVLKEEWSHNVGIP